MRPQRIGLIALLTVLATLAIDNFQLIQNPKSKIHNSQVLAQTPDARKAEADRLFEQGIQQFHTSQFEAALQSWQQVLTIYREIKDRQREGRVLGNLGNAYHSLGDYPKAIEYYQQVLVIARQIQDRQAEGMSLGNLGNAYYSLGAYTKAIEYSQQWLAIAQEIKDRESEGKALSNLGNAYHSLGDYAKAINYHQQVLVIARQIQDRQAEGMSLGNLGNAYRSLGEYTKAIEYSQQWLAIAREIKDRQNEGKTLGGLGLAYYFLGNYAKAIEYSQQWLAIAREIKDRRSEGKALGNLGNAYHSLGYHAKAIDYTQQVLAIAQEIKDRQTEGIALGALGIAYSSLGDYTKAIEYHQQYLALTREIKDRLGEGASLGYLGIAYSSLGDYAKAIEYHQQSLAIAREIKDRLGEGRSLGSLGIIYYSLGDYAKAIEYHQQNLAIAQEIGDKNGESASLGSLGIAYYSLGDYAKAIEYHQQSLAIAQEIGDKNGEGQSLNNLGATLLKSGSLTQSEKILHAGIETWEALRERLGNNDAYKVSIFEQQARTYRILQEVLIAQNNPNAALEIAERGRARAFAELLARRNTTTSDSANSANSSITPPTIEQLRQIAKQQNATLVEYSIIYNNFTLEGKEESHESELYIWVIQPTGEITFGRSDLKPLWQQQNTTLANLVNVARESIGVRRRGGLGAIASLDEADQTRRFQQLHQLLIEPISDLLPTDPNARVVFIPQSSLFLVPFPALQGKDGKYLIEKHTILTSPSIQVLQLTHKQRQRLGANSGSPLQGNDAIVVGNPTMPSVPPEPGQPAKPLSSLPGAETEANAIAPLLNTKPLIGNLATKSAVVQLLPKARIIHLATHGLLDDVRGIGSAIALAPDSPSSVPPLSKTGIGGVNGLLTAEEILDMKLNAELVVLSGCDTGRGRITGDGIIGLSRSLISAGVPSVVVSLWQVPDAPTASLMTNFYQNLQKNPDKAQALRQAMLTTMKQHPNPRDWAAFTLIGEAQ
jgi:CHAT domain-containing protein